MINSNKKLTVVTGNKGKAEEIASITGYEVGNIKLDVPEVQSLDVEEVAREKVKTAYKELKKPVIVDDTGMSIEALNGLPGALIIWFIKQVGPEGILKMVKDEKNRKASVVTCIAYMDENGVRTFMREVKGELSQEPRGEGGFGYDPIFIPDGYNKTYAEMSVEEKNAISMRRQALDGLKEFLENKK